MTQLTLDQICALGPVQVLARTIDGEARGEGFDEILASGEDTKVDIQAGMQAVGNVVLNRIKHPGWWGHNCIEDCLKPEQFDCWMPKDPNYARLTDPNWSDPHAVQVATDLLAGKLEDNTNGSTSYLTTVLYHSVHCPPWALHKDPDAVVNHQSFFKVP